MAPPLDPAFGTTIVDGVSIAAEPVAPGAGAGQ
jgi:serine/threonine-protein kinase